MAEKTITTLCKSCGEDHPLDEDFLCVRCWRDARRILAENNSWHERYSKMSEQERWEKAKAAL